MTRRRDMWLWDPRLLRPVVLWSIVGTVVLVMALYPVMGPESLGLLFVGIIGPITGLIFGVVGRKVKSLRDSMSAEQGVMEEALIVINILQSPGMVVLTDQTLRLVPIVGAEKSINRTDIKSVRMVRFFNGKALIGKRWLVLSTHPRLGFALPESTAKQWHARLLRQLK